MIQSRHFFLFAFLLGIVFAQTCDLAKTLEECGNKPDCQWQADTSSSSCQDEDLGCSLLTASYCTGKCALVGEEGTCIQFSGFGCVGQNLNDCNSNAKCVWDDITKCTDRNYNCGDNNQNRGNCLSAKGICFWQATKSGKCQNATTCSGKVQTSCTQLAGTCKWVIGGTCVTKVLEIDADAYSIHISASFTLILLIISVIF